MRKRGFLSGHDGIDKSLLATDSDLDIPGKYSSVFPALEAIVGSAKLQERLLTTTLMTG